MSPALESRAPSGRKFRSVQALRAIAVLLVVAVHIGAPHGFEARYIGGARLTGWTHFPGLVGVDLFFVLSGLIITTTSWRSFDAPGAWRRFLYRRVTRIYPVYLIVTTLILIVFLVRPGLVNSHDIHRPETVPSLLIWPQPGDPLLAVGWTLVYEMYFYVIFTAALWFGRRRLPWILGGWATATVVLHVVLAPTRDPYLYVVSNLMNLEFAFGAGIGLLVARGVLIKPRLVLAGSCAALTGLLGYLLVTNPADFPSAWFRAGAIGGSFALLVYGAVGLESSRRFSVPPVLERIGDGSYSIYLWHVPILAVLGLVVQRVGPRPAVPHAVTLISAYAVAVVSGLWLYDRIERPLLHAFHTRAFGAPQPPGRRWNSVAEADITSLAGDAGV